MVTKEQNLERGEGELCEYLGGKTMHPQREEYLQRPSGRSMTGGSRSGLF